MAPEVSVCIPAYRAAEYLPETMRSVLASDHSDFEVVVIDNASPDGTAEVASRFTDDPRVRFIPCTEHLNLADNWRRAMEYCQGTYVKLVCADDLIHPAALRLQADVLRGDSGVSVVASRRHVIDSKGRLLARRSGLQGMIGRHTARDVARQSVRLGINPIGEPGSVMFRRTDYEDVGGWDSDHVFNMDLDLILRLLSRGDLIGMSEPLAAFRIWPESLSGRHSKDQFRENLTFLRQIRTEYGIVANDWLVKVAALMAWNAWDLRRRVWASLPLRRTAPIAIESH